MSARFFALHDGAVANGSVVIVRHTRELGRYAATYINGDYMDSVDLAGPTGTAAKVAELTASGLREYPAKDFYRLAPACLGGRGGPV